MKKKVLLLLLGIIAWLFRPAGMSFHSILPGVAKTTDTEAKSLFATAGIPWGNRVLIRVFKQEKELELWAEKDSVLVLLKVIPVCAASGIPGPKRKEGDLQVPEGFYTVQHFNFNSQYHLSLLLSYPNTADLFFADPSKPGGDICIHGHCASIGCVAIRDAPIELVFSAAHAAAEQGSQEVPVHIFPCRMKPENCRLIYAAYPEHKQFWDNLRVIYKVFEAKPRLYDIRAGAGGQYFISEE